MRHFDDADLGDFAEMVIATLLIQQRYFRDRTQANLAESKEAESVLRKTAEGILSELGRTKPKLSYQQTLFDAGTPTGLPD